MEEKEIWKDIEGFEGMYQVSNMGNVKSLERTVWCGLNGGLYKTVHERILKPRKDRGYLRVRLYKDGKSRWYLVHQLVAIAFCENPEGYTEVNHIDEDKTNNCAKNLEYCSRSYNMTYNGRANKVGKKVAEKLRGRKQSEEHIKKRAEKHCKPVLAIDKITGLILKFVSSREAEKETGIPHGNICACCTGKRNSAGGFYWMFANDDAE